MLALLWGLELPWRLRQWKRLLTMWETQVWSLGRKDSLEKKMATHSSTLTWKIPWETRALVKRDPAALFLKGAFIPWVTHFQKWKIQSHAESAQKLHLFNPYWNQDVLCIPFYLQGSCIMYIIFWPGGLLTFYDLFLIKAGQSENLFFL